MTSDGGVERHDEELDAERAVNERYQHELRALVARQGNVTSAVTTARSHRWVDGAPSTPASMAVVGPIVGRVAFTVDDKLLGRGFYVGSWYRSWGGVQVVSWVAPVASLFYEGRRSTDTLAPDVSARRTFVAQDSDIRDFVDDVEAASVPEPFAKPTDATIDVPAAPKPVVRPSQAPPSSPAPAPASAHPELEGRQALPPSEEAREPALRAEQAVLIALERPRAGRLGSVLATLQPDQYRLVTWPDDEPLVVQGQPGTGKTIIATHRAAYLSHPDREMPPPLQRVWLVGPTEQFVEHVRGSVADLGAEGVEVVSLPGVLSRLAGLASEPPTGIDERLDTSYKLGFVLTRAASVLREAGALGGSRAQQLRRLVDAVTTPAPAVRRIVDQDVELSEWLKRLTWERAEGSSRFLPFLAAAGLAVQPLRDSELVDHLIVDEAQDIRPLEWRILEAYLRQGATLSIFGDVNQRRCDWTAPNWMKLIEDLELDDEPGKTVPQVLTVGYRSTREILRFANQLLPKEERVIHALRSGPQPEVFRVRRDVLIDETLNRATTLSARHADGLVAIITMHPQPMSDRCRKRGWTRSLLRYGWMCDGRTILILHPQNARGLEYDGVVVVEPEEFPENVGRLGLLYTSLTRAAKELAVLHARSLPRNLRAPAR